jgi:hypothetical protein
VRDGGAPAGLALPALWGMGRPLTARDAAGLAPCHADG